MKIIDILNKMANGELEDEFKFCLEDEVYTYTKEDNSIRNKCHNKIGQTKIIETYLNKEVLLFKDNNQEVIEENKEIEEKLDWEEIIGSIGKPLWDNKKKIWRVLDSYYREGNSFKISFSDTNNLECFENQELYFKEREENKNEI